MSEFEQYFNQAQSGELKDNVIKALLFAVQAIIEQRIGERELSKFSFNKARDLIQPYFDMDDNFNVGYVYYFFCFFELSNANYKRATFYHNILKYYVDEIKKLENSQSIVDSTMRRLKNLSRLLEMNLRNASNIDSSNPLEIAKLFPSIVYA